MGFSTVNCSLLNSPNSFGLFQQDLKDSYLPCLKPILKRNQNILSMFGCHCCLVVFVCSIQRHAQQGFPGLKDYWAADFNKSEQPNDKRPQDGRLHNKNLPPQHSRLILRFLGSGKNESDDL